MCSSDLDALTVERNVLIKENDALTVERNVLIKENDVLTVERNVLAEAKNALTKEKNILMEEKNVYLEAKNQEDSSVVGSLKDLREVRPCTVLHNIIFISFYMIILFDYLTSIPVF